MQYFRLYWQIKNCEYNMYVKFTLCLSVYECSITNKNKGFHCCSPWFFGRFKLFIDLGKYHTGKYSYSPIKPGSCRVDIFIKSRSFCSSKQIEGEILLSSHWSSFVGWRNYESYGFFSWIVSCSYNWCESRNRSQACDISSGFFCWYSRRSL